MNNVYYIDPAGGGRRPVAAKLPKLSKRAMESYRKWAGNWKKAAAVDEGKKPGAKSPPKLSKSAMESYRKWQAEAEKQGGPNAKIVVSKPKAKRIILEMFHDEGVPMNINEM